ncbi:hypothetical protein GN958_ATG19301 [Phytophthora infestans]|uniref:Uncharacterized protein n=1 Tax=Phytophthora infestans TaxID=4787 RepID=A0A8S9TS49_PHYIN|nr:hypothetical protein GN958_ATG19301 [Phytophthora infestans]
MRNSFAASGVSECRDSSANRIGYANPTNLTSIAGSTAAATIPKCRDAAKNPNGYAGPTAVTPLTSPVTNTNLKA